MKKPILNKEINVLDLEMASFVSKITKENKELRKEYRKYKKLQITVGTIILLKNFL